MKVAGFDIGTNTVRCVVLEKRDGKWRHLHYYRKVTRLGEGLVSTGVISDSAFHRTEQALMTLRAEIERMGVECICAAGTYSFRQAHNGEEVAKKIGLILKRPVRILSSEEEASLMVKGVFLTLSPFTGDAICVDIGGGSTECIRLRAGEVVSAVSLPTGVVTLVEEYLSTDPPSQDDLTRIYHKVKTDILNSPVDVKGARRIYGNCGTFSALAMMNLGLQSYEREKLHGYIIKREDFERLKQKIVLSHRAERIKMPGIGRGREDVIIAGVVLLQVLMELSGAGELVVSEDGWLEAFTLQECGT